MTSETKQCANTQITTFDISSEKNWKEIKYNGDSVGMVITIHFLYKNG